MQARLEMTEYTTQVLDVVKGKFGLKNRSEALNKLAEECGSEYVEQQPSEMVLRELDAAYEDHKKNHQERKMSDTELKKLLGL
jgi:metal-responsive CopG/Arc/MetJ family transcriptional regulator